MLSLSEIEAKSPSAKGMDQRLASEYENVRSKMAATGISMDETSDLMFSNHVICVLKRIHAHEALEPLPEDLFSEISPKARSIAAQLLSDVFSTEQMAPDQTEVMMLATHIQVAMHAQQKGSTTMSKEILVVIGHRMGKGDAIARGVEKAGGKAYVIPGMAADMKLGDVMHEMNADLGVSECGSGGAGALAAQNKYGYRAKYEIRSVEAACTAVTEGCKVVGLGFLDTEELGERLVEAYRNAHAE